MAKDQFDVKVKALKPKATGSETAATLDLLTRYLTHAQTKLREVPLGVVDNVVELLEALFAGEDVTVTIQKAAYIQKKDGCVQVVLGKSPDHFNVYAVANGRQATIFVDPARPGGNYRDTKSTSRSAS